MIPRIISLIFIINFYFIYSIAFTQNGKLNATFTLENFNGVYVPFQNGIPVPSFEKQNRQIISLKGIWKKQRFTADHDISLAQRDSAGYLNLVGESQGRYLSAYNDGSWEDKIIPSVENIMNTFPKVPEYYQEGVWYRYKFDLPDSLNGKFIKLIFYSVNYIADVWINGEYLGYHEGGYTPFAFDVSGKLVYSGQNVIAVRVDNPEWGKRNDIVPYPAVDWFNYTGIIHDVYLEVANPVSVIRTDIVPKSTNGDIQATVIVLNKSGQNKSLTAKITIYNAEINQANLKSEYISDLAGQPAIVATPAQGNTDILKDSIGVWRTDLIIENPKLWSPKNPNLYVIKVSLIENGNLIDEYYTQFGIRTVSTAADKVLLNNNVVFFTGVARHEDHPLYGRSIPIDTIFSDLEKVKGINANFLRTAHYPNHPYTYLIADRLGITVMEEIPVWQFDLEEAWQIQNNERHIHEQMFKEMVYKDYNRPSILLWSTCNECKDVNNRKIFIQNMGNDLNNKIQDGRLLTQSAAADRPGPEDPSQTVCDVAGWTLYFGIFYGTSYSGGTNNFLINAKAQNPGKPVLDTEFGYWSSEDNSTTDRQLRVFNDTFNSFKLFAPISTTGQFNSNGFLMGITWWCIFDWYSHGHPNGYQSMGLYSMDRSILKTVGQTLRDAYLPYFNLGGIVTEVEEEGNPDNPANFSLSQNYPNPFNPITKIKYSIPSGGTSLMKFAQLKVYDVLGNKVATLVNEEKPAGDYEVKFDGSGLPSGIYFYQLKTGNYIETKRMILIK